MMFMDNAMRIIESYNENDSLKQQLAAANAELAETYTDEHGTVWTRPTAWAYAAVCKANDKNREAKEQAEAQCAAMRNCLEELSCLGSRIGRGNSIGNDIASRMLDKTDAGTALLAENKRMREALGKIIAVTSKCLSHEEMKDKMKGIAKAALEDKP